MKLFYKLSVFFIIYALLAIPDNKNSIHFPTKNSVKVSSKWWGKFAQNLVKFRITSKQNQVYEYSKHRQQLKTHLENLLLELTEPDNPVLDSISYHINKLSALASLLPHTIPEFREDVATWRKLLKYQSRYWDTSSDDANERLFQLIIECRLAFESALIQSQIEVSQWSSSKNKSALKAGAFNKRQYKSGDIIAFSSFSKDNSYLTLFKSLPNAHKHLGCIYINSGVTSVIYIDHSKGLSVIPMERFINEIAPNGIILRLRDDILALLENPALPSLASANLFQMATSGDYNFDIESQAFVYDWELISRSFAQQGLILEAKKFNRSYDAIYIDANISYLSPFELELDHRFVIIEEWHLSSILYQNRLLAAVTASIIEHQVQADFINYLKLPFYRLIKGYSVFIGQFGLHQPIPSGVSAQSQLVYDALEKKQQKLLRKLESELKLYEQKRNHKATYLKMMQKANEIMVAQKDN